jgi:hypothetical protein
MMGKLKTLQLGNDGQARSGGLCNMQYAVSSTAHSPPVVIGDLSIDTIGKTA